MDETTHTLKYRKTIAYNQGYVNGGTPELNYWSCDAPLNAPPPNTTTHAKKCDEDKYLLPLVLGLGTPLILMTVWAFCGKRIAVKLASIRGKRAAGQMGDSSYAEFM